MPSNNPKVAFVYDRVNKFGGAERVLLSLHQLFPEAPIYTLVHQPQSSLWAKDIQVIPTFLNHISYFRDRHELLAPLAPLAFETLNFDIYDLVISITSESAKSIITKPHTLHLCYCLTPTRYLWSGRVEYRQNPNLGIISPLVKNILHKNIKYFQNRDLILSHRPDYYFSISKETQKRVKKYYHQDSDIVYPPIDYNFWSDPKSHSQKIKNSYLVVSRLVPYKKVDLVIKAFTKLRDKKLIVVGTGSQLPHLKSLATPNIQFLGGITDLKLRSLYSQSQAVIFPQQEDFGLVPLEAQACGTPILAFNKGGAKETVIAGKTGLFFDQQTPDSIIGVINQFEHKNHQITANRCRTNAQKFSQASFQKQFSVKVKILLKKHKPI